MIHIHRHAFARVDKSTEVHLFAWFSVIVQKMPSAIIFEELYPGEEDLVYEEEILRNPFTLKLWWWYLVAP